MRSAPYARSPAPSFALVTYFYSGWAFFVPYLFLYLTYAGLAWPANQGFACLLHAYWALHAIHLLLFFVASVNWWRATPHLKRRTLLLGQAIPWTCLVVLLWIPGPYLEFPADTWEHYRRINVWAVFDTVRASTFWAKSNYFFVYSLISPTPPELDGLRIYNTGIGLLLCWQYYRLALAVGVTKRSAFLFVLLALLFSGNHAFSFFRYYGIASTLPAHLAAVAVIRIALETFAPGRFQPGAGWIRALLAPALSLLLLFALMIFNHLQAVLISLLGLSAVGFWQLAQRRPQMLLWLGTGVIVASIVLVFFSRETAGVLETYHKAGWLTFWYGFNLVPSSAAGSTSLQILGLFGLVNMALAVCLLPRNHVAGWLTVTPLLALVCPLFAIPFARMLAGSAADGIVMSVRVLFEIPVGLALVAFCQDSPFAGKIRGETFFVPLLGVLAAALVIPPSAPFFNRLWHTLATTPGDLRLLHVEAMASAPAQSELRTPRERRFLTAPGLGFAAATEGIKSVIFEERLIRYPRPLPPSATAKRTVEFMNEHRRESLCLYLPSPFNLYTPQSLAGRFSGHWLPQEIGLLHAAKPELEAAATRLGATRRGTDDENFYWLNPPPP